MSRACGRHAKCFASASIPSAPFSSVAFGPSVWVLTMSGFAPGLLPGSRPHTVSVAATEVIAALSFAVTVACREAALRDRSLPVASPTHTAGQPGSPAVGSPDADGYGVMNGLYWLAISSSDIPV